MLLHEDSQGAIFAPNAMVLDSWEMISGLSRLKVFMRVLRVELEAKRTPSTIML